MAKQNLPNQASSVPTASNLTSEKVKYDELYLTMGRKVSGQVEFTSTTSGITYRTIDYPADATIYNKGQDGLLNILENVLENYFPNADEYNYIMDNLDNMNLNILKQSLDISNNRILIDEILTYDNMTSSIDKPDSIFYDFPDSSKALTAGTVDLTKAYCATVTQGANSVTVTSMVTNLITDFKVGQEVTLQDNVNKEFLIIDSIADPVITFKSNIVNIYTSGANLYRSSLAVNGSEWEVEWDDLLFQNQNPEYDTWKTDFAWGNLEWADPVIIGDNIYAREYNSPYRMKIYNITTDTWSFAPTNATTSWYFPVKVGTDIYARRGGVVNGYQILKYDTITGIWDESLSSASMPWQNSVSVGSDIYVNSQVYPYPVFKYDTLTDVWTEGLAETEYSYAVSIGSFIYSRELSSPYRMVRYSTLSNVWVPLATPNELWDYPVVVGTDIYAKSFISPYRILKYDTLTNTWDKTLATPNIDWQFTVGLEGYIYVRKYGSPYNIMRYDTNTVRDIIDTDIRLNIESFENIDSIVSWLYSNNTTGITITSSLSIQSEGADETFIDLADSEIEIDSSNNYYISSGSVANSEKLATLKYNLTRLLTTDDFKIKRIQGGVA